MNLKMIRAENQTKDLLLSVTKNCDALIEQTPRKAEETLEFKMTKPNKRFHFIIHLSIEASWMLSLTNLEVYINIFSITQQNNKFEL